MGTAPHLRANSEPQFLRSCLSWLQLKSDETWNIKTEAPWLGRGLVGKVLALQTRGPELSTQKPCQMGAL